MTPDSKIKQESGGGKRESGGKNRSHTLKTGVRMHLTCYEYLPEVKELETEYPQHAIKYRSEALLQAACYLWWNKHFRASSRLFHVPNGGTRIAGEAIAMTAQGLVAGVFDLEFKYYPAVSVPIEMKNGPLKVTKTGTFLDAEQVVYANYLDKLGFTYYCAKSFLEFAIIICRELKLNVRDYL